MNLNGLGPNAANNMFTPPTQAKGLSQGKGLNSIATQKKALEKNLPKTSALDNRDDREDFESSLDQAMGSGSGGMPSISAPKLSEGPIREPVGPNKSIQTGETPRSVDTQIEAKANSLTRRVVWNEFLRKMGDLGVSPEDVMGAFSKLSEEDLVAPPEQSVNQLAMALGLNDQKTVLAKQYFSELIQRTDSKSLGEEYDISKHQLSLAMLTERNLQRKATAKSIDGLEQNFFLKNRMQMPTGLTPALAAQMNAQMAAIPTSAAMKIEDAGFDSSPRTSPGFEIPGAMMPGMQPGADPTQFESDLPFAPDSTTPNEMLSRLQEQGLSPAQAKAVLIKLNEIQEQKAQGNVAAVPAFLPPGGDAVSSVQAQTQSLGQAGTSATHAKGVPLDMNALAAMVGQPISTAAAPTKAAAAPVLAAGAAMGGLKAMLGTDGAATKSDEDSGEELTDANLLAMGAGNDKNVNGPHVGDKAEFLGKLQVPQAPKEMTAGEAIQQAKIMIKDGGGEMKVTLSPEGMGEIAMRVQVENGKVNVHMITESDEAKKLLERTLGDLKVGLTQNNLHVDSIKVDTATNLGKQLDQQYQESQRQMAHQTLEQFRQDQQGWRRSFFETGSSKPYASQGEARRDVNAPTASSSKRSGARRLDLVA